MSTRPTDDLGTQRSALAALLRIEAEPAHDKAAVHDTVDRATGRDISLHVRSVLIEELTRDGALYAPAPSTLRARVGR